MTDIKKYKQYLQKLGGTENKTYTDENAERDNAATDKKEERLDKTYVGGDDVTRPLIYNPPTDDELLSVAKATYENGKNESIKSANDEADRKKKSLYKSINGQLSSAEERKVNNENIYKSAKDNLENAVLKRGIQRSSASIGGLKDLEAQKISYINKIDDDTKNYIDKINKEIYDLESDLGKEISSINEKYANAVQIRLHELKNERDNKINEVIKYNNTLDLFYPSDYYTDGTLDGAAKEEDVDINNVKERYRERIDEVLKDYLSIGDAEKALELYQTNESVKRYLGKYYDYVYKLLKNNVGMAESN